MSRRAGLSFFLLICSVIALWASFPIILQHLGNIIGGDEPTWVSRGVFGDSYGVLNSLFSALAFCGVAMTLYLQKIQLSRSEAQGLEDKQAAFAHSRLMAITAALHYYNAEADRLQHAGLSMIRDEEGAIVYEAWERALNLNTEKRQSAIAELEKLLTSAS